MKQLWIVGVSVAAAAGVAWLATRPLAATPVTLASKGRATWLDWHQAARSYSPVNAAAFNEKIMSGIRALPCQACIDHGLAYVAEHPIDLATRAGLQRWLCDFHNDVNARRGVPLFDCSKSG